jgi:hypothetical protein
MSPDLDPKSHAPNLNKAVAALGSRVQTRSKQQSAQKANEPVQLPMWHDDLRGMPNSFARGALFTAAKSDSKEDREYLRDKRIATVNGIKILSQGEELRQDDCSVWLTILHFGRRYELGQAIPFTAYQMLKELGWSINSAEYNHLRECFKRLKGTSVEVSDEKGTIGYTGSLIRSFSWKDTSGEKLSSWTVELDPKVAALFGDLSFTLLDPAERKAIGGRSPLAQWLHLFLCTHREPFAISVRKYHELSASRASNLNDFRRRLKAALVRLEEIGFLKDFEIKEDVVHVKRVPRTYPAPLPPVQASLQLQA